MSKEQMMGTWLRRFLAEHIVSERNLARNTQRSYRDTLALLLPFLSSRRRKAVDRLTVLDLNAERVLQFLAYLEEVRGCSAQTRNQRLAAIRSFARFVASRSPEYVEWYGQIRAIPLKKATPQPITWLEKDKMDAILEAPSESTSRGRRERTLLLFLYNTGARASEAAQLVVGDLKLNTQSTGHALATLRGKGGKLRLCPLWSRTERMLTELIQNQAAGTAVFLNRYGMPITRFGIYRMVDRCAAMAAVRIPSLVDKRVTPHMIRHTTATHLLRAGVDLNTIRAWLGHATLDTTNIYAEIDLEMKRKAIALCDSTQPNITSPWKDDSGVMAFLKSL